MTSRPDTESAGLDLVADLRRIVEGPGVETEETSADHKRARDLADATGPGSVSTYLTAVAYAADLLANQKEEGDWTPGQVETLLSGVAQITQLPFELVSIAVGREALRSRRLLELAPAQAIVRVLDVLELVAPVGEPSLWALQPDERIRCLAYVGARPPTRRARQEARQVIQGLPSSGSGERRAIRGFAVRWEQNSAALVVRAKAEDRLRWRPLVEEAADTLGLILDRQELLDQSLASHAGLVASLERRQARLGFDLHDGAIQEITALAADLRFFRRQLGDALPDTDVLGLLLGRVDDLEARLYAVDSELRELVRSFAEPTIVQRPFLEALRSEVESFARQTRIETQLDVDEDIPPLTDSQRIALLRIVQEALTNVREHSRAGQVRITVSHSQAGVHAEVKDDGRGFDVERTLTHAAKKGRLGLVGMSERARLLGGAFEIRTRSGGPTTISVTIPCGHPDARQPHQRAMPRAASR